MDKRIFDKIFFQKYKVKKIFFNVNKQTNKQ